MLVSKLALALDFLCGTSALVNGDKIVAVTHLNSSYVTREDVIDAIISNVVQKRKSKSNYLYIVVNI